MSIFDGSLSPSGVGTSNDLESDRSGSDQDGSIDVLGIRWQGPILESSVLSFVRQRGPKIAYVFIENPKK